MCLLDTVEIVPTPLIRIRLVWKRKIHSTTHTPWTPLTLVNHTLHPKEGTIVKCTDAHRNIR